MKKANNTSPEQENPRMPLTRRNYILLAVGFAVILLGFVLMAGGGSDCLLYTSPSPRDCS